MNVRYLLCLIAIGLIQPFAAFGKDFAIQVRVVRFSHANVPIKDAEITVKAHGTTRFTEKPRPGRTDSSGKTTITFKCSSPNPQVVFVFTDNNDLKPREPWFLYHHGRYPDINGTELTEEPFTVRAPKADQSLDGFPRSELANVFLKAVKENNTTLVSKSVAAAIILPTGNRSFDKLPNPASIPDIFQKDLHFPPKTTQAILDAWKGSLKSTAKDSKDEEKALAAILDYDLSGAAEYAIKWRRAGNTGGSGRIIADDTAFLTTIYGLNSAAIESAGRVPSSEIDSKLVDAKLIYTKDQLNTELKIGRQPASMDWGKYGNYATEVRNKAQFNK